LNSFLLLFSFVLFDLFKKLAIKTAYRGEEWFHLHSP